MMVNEKHSKTPYVTLKIETRIGYITFFSESHNALSSSSLNELAKTIAKAGKDSEITVIVLRSAGNRSFCAGANFNELINIRTPDEGRIFFSGFASVINAMRQCPKPIIGRIQGKAVGGGVGLVAAADYCLASEQAAVKLSELSIGIAPLVIEPAVSRKVGVSVMATMSLQPTTFFAAQFAKENGLYNQVLKTLPELDAAVNTLAETLSKYHPKALELWKKSLWKDTAHWDKLLLERAKQSGALVLSAFTKDALARFR